MSTSQRLETTFGLLAVLCGAAGLALVLLAPLYHFSNGGTANIVQVGLSPITLIFFTIFFLALFCTAIGAVMHSRMGGTMWIFLLWLSAAIASIIMLLAIISVGLFFFPGVLLAWLACALSLKNRAAVASEQAAR